MLPYILDRRDDCRHRGSKGMAATGIGLAAGLGGGALLFAIAGLWGLNKASEARAAGTNQGLAGVATALAALNGHVANERASREAWQAANAPSIRNYVDVSNTPVAASTSVSNAVADALALAAAPTSVSVTAGTTTNAISAQPCKVCGRVFVSETPLALAVA